MKIITHNGRAHMDDFLACCVLLAKYPGSRVYRQAAPTEEDLNDPETFVLDFGRRYEPELRNFDHHQISGGEQCAFTLILDYLGIRDYRAMPWIKFVEIWDHCGPTDSMKLLGSNDKSAAKYLFSPIEENAIQLFSEQEFVSMEGSPILLYGIMGWVGRYILKTAEKFEEDYRKIGNAQVIFYNGFNIIDFREFSDDLVMSQAAKYSEEKSGIDIVLAKNSRGAGKFRMIRRRDDIDFRLAAGLEGVDFVHQSGFLITFSGNPGEILLTTLGDVQ